MLNGFDLSYNVEGKERKIEANFRLYYNKTTSVGSKVEAGYFT